MAVPATGHVDSSPATPPTPAGALAPRLLVTAPDLVACAVAGFSLGPMILLLVNRFEPAPALITGVVGAVVALWLRGVDRDVPERRAVQCTAVAAGIVLVWFLGNVAFTGQNVYATRDPATYNITARWLMDNASLHIDTHTAVFGTATQPCLAEPGLLCNGGAGFSPVNPGQVYSQGNHLMPALGAVVGWLSGVQGMFRANLLLGALALFVFYGLVRRVVSGPLALLALTAMAVSMPMVYVSRDTYSEPLMMLFLMGSLALLYRAMRTGRVREFAVAGFVAGCSAMVRIDSYGALLSILLTAIVVAALAGPGARRAALGRSAALVLGCGLPTVVGWLDVTWLSYGYYRDQRSDILLEVKGAIALAVVGVIVVALAWQPAVRRALASARFRLRLSEFAGGAVVLVFAVLLSRPLWQQTHGPVNLAVAAWQRASHVAGDGTQLYNETALHMIGAYYSWVTVLLGLAGYVILLDRLIRRRDYPLVGILAMGLSMSALYLWNWKITPDQPWAMRRFVPVVVPVLLLAAMVGLRALGRLRPRGRRGRRVLRVVTVLAGATVVIYPAVIMAPMTTTREEVPQYQQVQAICHALGPHGAVLQVDAPTALAYVQTMRSYCGVPSMGLVGATTAQLAAAQANAARHGRRLFVMAQDPRVLPLAGAGSIEPFSAVTVQRWPNVIGRPPTQKGGRRTVIYLGTVGADGRVTPVAPA